MLNFADAARARVIDRCLQQRQRNWTLQDLAAACGAEARLLRASAKNPSTRSVARSIERMRSGELGYEAPIVVHKKKFYAYAEPGFQLEAPTFWAEDKLLLREITQLLRSFPHWPLLTDWEELSARLMTQLKEEPPERAEQPIILFDQKQLRYGQEWIRPLYAHIRDRQRLLLTYQPFTEPEPLQLIVSPYLLKTYNNRWFVLAYEHKAGRVKTFALDRIQAIKLHLPHLFYTDPRFEPTYWFKYLYGVSMPYEAQPEEVIIACTPLRAKYLLSKPLHGSQALLSESETESHFRFFLIINFEWKQLLLSYGSEVRVCSPQHLADAIQEEHFQAWQLYAPS